jgi:hypothetical protein
MSGEVLAYAGPIPRWRRARVWLALGVIVALLAAHETLWPMARAWERRRQRSLADRQWYAAVRQHVDPPTKLKYTENPADAPPGGFAESYPVDGHENQIGYAKFGGTRVDARVVRFSGWSPVASAREWVNLFIHERTTSAGVTRLVIVMDPSFEKNTLNIDWQQVAVRDGFCMSLNGDAARIDMSGICAPGEIRIFAGQPHPTDAARFSIPFTARGRSGFIDGVFVSQPPPVYEHFESDPERGHVVKLSVRME